MTGPALPQSEVTPQRMRHDQNVGEQDRGIKAEAADRLQRHLYRETPAVAEVEEASCLGARLARYSGR